MKTTLKLLAVLALTLVAFRPNPNVAAADVFKYKGQGVYARFSSTDASGCVRTSVSVFGFTDVRREAPSERDPLSEVHVWLSQYNECTGDWVDAYGIAPLSKSDFKFDGYLGSIRLAASAELFDWYSSSTIAVDFDLAWNGVSDLSRRVTHRLLRYGSCHENLHATEDLRYARATGTVTDGITNFTPDPSVDAYLFSTKNGQIWHGCQ